MAVRRGVRVVGKRKFCVEVGGTFTDWVLVDGDAIVATGKVPSTPSEPALGVLTAAQEALVPLDTVEAIMHGSTVATNAVLERTGATTALLVTEGFRDVLDIQRQTKSKLFDLFYRHPGPLVPRDRIIEVRERVGPGGDTRVPLDLEGVADAVEGVVARDGVTSVAICCLHSYANPEHEERLERHLEERFPDLSVSRSSSVLPRFREYERMSTTVISAYLRPKVDGYVKHLDAAFTEAGFAGHLSIMQANGGTVPADHVRRHAARMVLSGPAAGVGGAIAAGRSAGMLDLLTLDMGGTSTDVCLVSEGAASITTEYKIGGLPLGIPMYDIVTVGAGGGSIATVDDGGAMHVGPASAGADPGPACYGRGGGSFTVTDANVVLGLIRPDTFLGGRMALSTASAHEAARPIASRLGMTVHEVAAGVVRLANATMAQAMRLVSIERGHDPREYAIVAFGGAGPLHALALAEELSVDRVLVPYAPGLLSAHGLALADTRQDYVQTRIVPLAGDRAGTILSTFESMRRDAMTEFGRYGIADDRVSIVHALDVRFAGQAYELTIDADDIVADGAATERVVAAFCAAHEQRYGHVPSGGRAEIVNFRLLARTANELRHLAHEVHGDDGGATRSDADLWIDGTLVSCPFIPRATLAAGTVVRGPCVVEEPTSTVYVRRGWRGDVDAHRNLLLTREAA
jgi:N-methylhydantoinase A